jgi:Rieske Fe-S protein
MMRISAFLLGGAILFGMGCRKVDDDSSEQVPVIPTDIFLNINLPEFNALQNPGGWVYITGGSRGIMVYRLGLNDFAVFDRHCTFQVAQGCRVNIEDSNITAKDENCCESVFSVLDGVPLSGPARRPLLRYQTQFNPNTNVLRIYNL